jgi:hypothetical protein
MMVKKRGDDLKESTVIVTLKILLKNKRIDFNNEKR